MVKEKNPQHAMFEKVYFMYTQNKAKFLSSMILLILLIVFAGEKLPIFRKVTIEKMVALEQKYIDWQKDPNSEEKYKSLNSAMNTIPSFGVLLEPEIAQIMIYENNANFKNIGKKVLSRTSPSYYVDFSNISMLISEKKYKDAYESSLELKSSLDKKSKDHLMIYPYNLLRICFLMKELKDLDKEIQAWNDLEKYVNEKETSFVAEIEKNNRIDLSDYISQRKQLLNKKSLFHKENIN